MPQRDGTSKEREVEVGGQGRERSLLLNAATTLLHGLRPPDVVIVAPATR